MRVRCLLHVPFEGPGAIADWARRRGHDFHTVRLFDGEPLPAAEDCDLLVVMGGPMSVHDESAHPWLKPEKALVARSLEQGRYVLGVCLGSQILAERLGSTVRRNKWKEIGWLPVTFVAGEDSVMASLPAKAVVFHWHGETYDLPPTTALRAFSEGCAVQAFEHPSALGLQFHLEATAEGVEQLLAHCEDDIGGGPYEQPPGAIRGGERTHGERVRELMFTILDRIADRIPPRVLSS